MGINVRKEIEHGLYNGFIDKIGVSLDKYKPKLLINNAAQGQKVLTSIISELNNCDEFLFSVAFITSSGLITLLTTLKELEIKGVKGKIIASSYLNFTDPKALKKLLDFKNIELRIVTNENLHSKGYVFRKNDAYNFIIGSSNMTQKALSENKEWNIRVSSMDQGSLILDTLNEFNKTFNNAVEVTHSWIDEYSEIYEFYKRKNKVNKDEFKLQKVADEKPSYDVVFDLKPKVVPNAMQVEALVGIESLRNSGENKALLISATGTGKTYLSCFDVAKVQPKNVLFVAHREQILNQSIISFKNVFGPHIKVGKVGGGKLQFDNRFVFSTIQTLSKQSVLDSLPRDYFDYIVFDETHRAGAKSYQKVLDHFEPNFLLGMTATPERTDDYNVCEAFDYNIAYEIRLAQAMKENMLCPFHYFGISELAVEGVEISENSEFKYLLSDERIRKIIEKINYYGFHGNVVKGLVFCSRNDEAKELSNAFNNLGYNTIALSGNNTQEEREEAIERLEDEYSANRLDYIFTVDIFNEGVDIPQVNQVIMLRPTQSAIIFVQQLGRGLRKADNKEYVVVLDFIGNYKNNFMIPIALSDDRSFNKDTVRRFVAEGNRVIPGCSTINFDAIAKKRIYESIDRVNFSSVAFIKESYQNLKYRLGRIPSLMDFEEHDSLDLARLFENKSLKSYHNFLSKYEEEYDLELNEVECKFIEFISVKLATGKRPHELIVINALLNDDEDFIDLLEEKLVNDYDIEVFDKTITNVVNVLTNNFATGGATKTYELCVFIEEVEGTYRISDSFKNLLENKDFKTLLHELVQYGLYRNKKYYSESYKQTSFQLYQKYSYEDVCRLLEWEKNMVALNIGGYKYDDKTKTYPIFINYHKDETISDSIKYEDRFDSSTILTAISKAKRRVDSNDVQTAYNAKENNVNIELFVRKNKDDKTSKEFYYLGRVNTIGDPHAIVMNTTGDDAVELTYKLETSVREDIYDYITEA